MNTFRRKRIKTGPNSYRTETYSNKNGFRVSYSRKIGNNTTTVSNRGVSSSWNWGSGWITKSYVSNRSRSQTKLRTKSNRSNRHIRRTPKIINSRAQALVILLLMAPLGIIYIAVQGIHYITSLFN